MVDGRSEREVARYFGIHRQTVKKMCQYAAPPGYRRKSELVSRKLAPFTGIIDSILERSEEHTSELQSRFGISYAVFCLKKKNNTKQKSLQVIQPR